MKKLNSKNREEWSLPEFWRGICTQLSIEGKQDETTDVEDAFVSDATTYKSQLLTKGYALVDQSLPMVLISKLRDGVNQLVQSSDPATFIFLFDETWQLARYSRRLLETATSNKFHFDVLAWYIDHEGGFSPHRDRQPDDVSSSFHPDGEAKFATHWIALTPATTSNSCLYMIPKDHDPGYAAGDDDEKDPLSVALPNKEAFQRIRAMPRDSGQSILFTHRIIHWGSIQDPEAPPRAAISFVCSDPSFEQPYIDPKYFTDDTLPPFSIRLLLVCAQLIIYHQRFQLSKDMLKGCFEYCKSMEKELEKSYWHKVAFEYVEAMKEDAQKNNELDESEEEEMMELMLKAEESGYGEYSDDYDDGSHEMEGNNDGHDDDDAEGDDDDSSDEEEGTLLFRAEKDSDGNDNDECSVQGGNERKRPRSSHKGP